MEHCDVVCSTSAFYNITRIQLELLPSVVFVFLLFFFLPKIKLKANKHDKNKIKHLLNLLFISRV